MLPYLVLPALSTKKGLAIIYGSLFTMFVALTFTAEGATALAVAITALIAAVFTGIVNLVVALKAQTKNEETGKALLEKTTEIHTATNGTLSTLTSANKVMQEKIEGLETLVASMVTATKAQTVAVTEAGNLTPPSAKRGKRGSLR